MHARDTRIELTLDERPGIESVCVSGDGYGWTRKQGGIRARGTVTLPGAAPVALDAHAVIDDTAAYYERHTRWRWSAGVGRSTDGRALAWNLVEGVNDPVSGSERTVWVDGERLRAAARRRSTTTCPASASSGFMPRRHASAGRTCC